MFRERRFRDLFRLIHSRFRRTVKRAGGARLPVLLERYTLFGASSAGEDSMFEEDLSMRALIRLVAPLDLDPVPLPVPVALLRSASTAIDDAAWHRRCPQAIVHDGPKPSLYHVACQEPRYFAPDIRRRHQTVGARIVERCDALKH